MAGISDLIETATGWLRSFVDLGLALILVFVIIEILFPGTTGIITNIATLVGSFAREGAVGLIALLLFLLVYRK